jgi:hypothetical protein
MPPATIIAVAVNDTIADSCHVVVVMQDLDFLATVLGSNAPWRIAQADFDLAKGRIEALVAYEGGRIVPDLRRSGEHL